MTNRLVPHVSNRVDEAIDFLVKFNVQHTHECGGFITGRRSTGSKGNLEEGEDGARRVAGS